MNMMCTRLAYFELSGFSLDAAVQFSIPTRHLTDAIEFTVLLHYKYAYNMIL